ncbi:MAG: 6-pyruvoyl trahydropterin synthase family protein, partial [Gemmatimonadaceae bacterium]
GEEKGAPVFGVPKVGALPTASLTRRISFSAAHRYSRPEWSDEKNASMFGACAWPNFHGHTYVCDVTVGGPIDELTGFVVDLGVLDEILGRQVKQRFDHRNINLDVPEFADGKLVPSGENLARFVFERVDRELPNRAKVLRVTVGEDDSLSATYSRE